MKNFTALFLAALFASAEASRVSATYATSTWNPPTKFGRSRDVPSALVQSTSELNVSGEGIDSLSISEDNEDSEERLERIAPASAKAALIAVVSATFIGGVRHAMELVL